MADGRIRGLDFGTSTSLVSESTALAPQVVPIGRTQRWIPTVVAKDGVKWFVGDEASALPESQVIRSIKRVITREQLHVIMTTDSGDVVVDADEAIVEVLRHIGSAAESNMAGLTDHGSVRLGCPAMWTGPQRERLVRLATRAGIAVGDATLIDEPIAAGIAWVNHRLRRGSDVSGNVLVFDMGGGTLDVAVLEVNARQGMTPAISVQAAVGVDEAGDALDELIAAELERKLSETGLDIDSHANASELRAWILADARAAKLELSDLRDVPVVFSYPHASLPNQRYSREELESAFLPQLTRALRTVEWALRAALMVQFVGGHERKTLSPRQARQLSMKELAKGIDHVLVMGGMARVPAVVESLGTVFSPEQIYVGIDDDPASAIVLGLAEQASYERLNLHRPGFDFVLEWFDDGSEVPKSCIVYRAYSPLYTPESAINTDSTKFRWDSSGIDLPRKGTAILKVRSIGGTTIAFRFDGREAEGHAFTFGSRPAFVSLEPNGRVFIRDGAGRESSMRIAQWPVIRGVRHEAVVVVKDHTDKRAKDPSLVWHQMPYD